MRSTLVERNDVVDARLPRSLASEWCDPTALEDASRDLAQPLITLDEVAKQHGLATQSQLVSPTGMGLSYHPVAERWIGPVSLLDPCRYLLTNLLALTLLVARCPFGSAAECPAALSTTSQVHTAGWPPLRPLTVGVSIAVSTAVLPVTHAVGWPV